LPRKKKQHIKVNNTNSLEGLMQEVYNDACGQINDAQRTINELHTSTTPEDVEDATKIAKAKIDAQKIKDSGIKIKLEVAKLQSDIIKHSGNTEKAVEERYEGKAQIKDFKAIRDMINNQANDVEDDNEDTNN
jgi:CRISPR/Cas system-associated endonuclease Cas1